MGKGGLNRLLLRASDVQGTAARLSINDTRAEHIRTVLCGGRDHVTIRVAVEGQFLHDDAVAYVMDDNSVRLDIPFQGRESLVDREKVVLMVAMQRPKVMARLIESAACVGVEGIVVVGAEKVEKSYWQCRLFREDGNEEEKNEDVIEDGLPGRARKIGERYDGRPKRRRVDELTMVRRRLENAIEQGCVDGRIPWVILEPRGVSDGMECFEEMAGESTGWIKVVANVGGKTCITEVVREGKESEGVILGIGPEGGWTEEEVNKLSTMGFKIVGLGERVLRSETAVVIGLGLAFEGMRLRRDLQ